MLNNLTKLWLHSRTRRHLKYVGYSDLYSCYSNSEFVADHDDLCRFIRLTKDCSELVKIFNYLEYMVCTLRLDKSAKSLCAIMAISIAIFIVYSSIVYVVGRYFIVPNVVMLAEHWKMSDFEFGVTILTAFITLPAFIETISACGENSGNGSMVLAEMMGKLFACFSSGFVSFCIKRNFSANPKLFTFHMLVIIFGLIYVYEIMFFKIVNDHEPPEDRVSFNLSIHATFLLIFYIVILALAWLRSNKSRKPEAEADSLSITDSLASDDYEDDENPIEYDLNGWELLTQSCSPFQNDVRANIVIKMYITPIWFVCSFMIPVYTKARPLNGWCKLQTLTSFLLFPVCFYFVGTEELFYGFLFICLLFAVLTMIITRKQQEPTHHELYAMFGIIAATNIYFLIDSELDNLLWQLLNYLADWKSDVALLISSPVAQIILVSVFSCCLVEQGHSQMAYGMIIGVAMFFTFTSLPLMVVQSCYSPYMKTTVTSSTETAYYFMLNIYVLIFLGCSMSNFELRKSLGITILIFAVVYVIFTCFSASWLMHTYGCQHSLYMFQDVIHANWA